jgi:hypothetical protein
MNDCEKATSCLTPQTHGLCILQRFGFFAKISLERDLLGKWRRGRDLNPCEPEGPLANSLFSILSPFIVAMDLEASALTALPPRHV